VTLLLNRLFGLKYQYY